MSSGGRGTGPATLEAEPPEPGSTETDAGENGSFVSGARVMAIGVASTGIFTFAYLATASHELSKGAYSRISVCWAIMFVILSVIYRPIEQLQSRTIAERAARGEPAGGQRTSAILQAAFASAFLVVALILHHQIVHDLFDGSTSLYWTLVGGTVVYAASYFARGYLSGHLRFALYGGLVFLESVSRFLFALAVAVGIGSGQGLVGLGMAVAPVASLLVMPFAFTHVRAQRRSAVDLHDATLAVELGDAAREGPAHAGLEEASTDLSLSHGARFAAAGVLIMLSEQTLMNAGVIVVAANSGFNLTLGLTGFVFNVLLIVRAPLQLFQAIQISILPHLTSLSVRDSGSAFDRAIRVTVLAIAAFSGAVTLGLLAIGPFVMKAVAGSHGFTYGRLGLAAVGLGMGLHLMSGTLNQALLAWGRAALAAFGWCVAAIFFVLFVAFHTIGNQVQRVEVGYLLSTLILAVLQGIAYRSAARAVAGA